MLIPLWEDTKMKFLRAVPKIGILLWDGTWFLIA
uniref:Uncharacterized protein n=1 Tax=Rhizophora mucronata TaxID=61149 RepID=A0A2P2QT20_RHIMU